MKIKQIIKSLFLTTFIIGGLACNTSFAFAANCSGHETAIINCTQTGGTDLKSNGVWALLLLAINILTAGIGIVAVGGIVYGSILYTTATSNPEQVKKAINIIVNVVIGIVTYFLAWSFLNYLIPGGVF